MTQYQKRLLIAEAGGFHLELGDEMIWLCRPCGRPCASTSSVSIHEALRENEWCIPDYFNSRDACIEVILGLNPIKRQDFIHALVMIVSPASQWHDMHMPELFNCLTATPEQLCEALGSALNLW